MQSQKKHHSSLLGIALTIFAVNKQKEKKEEIYWVIAEDDQDDEILTVKYYSETNQLIHTQTFPGLKKGILDEDSMYQLNQIKSEILNKRA
ncbi:MAG: hypothetical protein NW226_10540 [Microscillaceae bacterium]|nr:hypothetical protein [Microscillaceae bacterium]